jgi:hypothetical protein
LSIFIPFDDLPTGHLVDCAEYAPFGFFGELAKERSLALVGSAIAKRRYLIARV